MFDVRYTGLRLVPSKAAITELMEFGLTLHDCGFMLENGTDAPRQRAPGTEEKWFGRGKKTYNIVVVKSFNNLYGEEVWVVTHVGKFGRKQI